MILFIGTLVGPSIKATRIVADEPVAVKREIENIWLGQEGAPGAGPVRVQQVPRATEVTMETEGGGLPNAKRGHGNGSICKRGKGAVALVRIWHPRVGL